MFKSNHYLRLSAEIDRLEASNVELMKMLREIIPYINADPNDPYGPISRAIHLLSTLDHQERIATNEAMSKSNAYGSQS
jgi:hypothetical protein